ncbi:ribonucleases P/MRP protein subunit POP1 isoform X1 [Trichogramma pretiosum]|uniref:ribonucleases P/MRP protein subunit POP1 isoform X1 n=1 Tax=Trichogramma pretiosum TaxID=7493 RepID=UPI0006C953C3|nr:ribonucleases P/MRP protein subunit POP1 isoform X1 [Trichogramma pretiosum]
MTDEKQFDEYLGGSEKLPHDVHILKIAAARASEIAGMNYNIGNPRQTKLIFQKLPVHMRRRAMSHNAKRMPRRLRKGHISQMTKSGLPPKSKRPSRKYRRRPKNLLLEYNRRQQNNFWLETHIWHAKRFKMVEKWGFKLPMHSNDRCFKASYRAVKNHCLLQDISYYTCLEIRGNAENLKAKLKDHCNQNELTFGAKTFMSGQREGTLMFYKKNGYPNHPIGHVTFMWNNSVSNEKSIWLWIHPAFYKNILEEIISNFNFNLNHPDQTKISEGTIPFSELKLNQMIKIPVFSNAEGCKLIILRNCLNRFRLSGPLCLSTITEAFKVPNLNMKFQTPFITSNLMNTRKLNLKNYSDESMELDTDDKDVGDSWFRNYYQFQNVENVESFKVQKEFFDTLKTLKSPSQLPSNMILGLTILDPRFFLPSKRRKSLLNSKVIENTLIPPALATTSSLWDENVRNFLSTNCKSMSFINNLRTKNLVPGVQNDELYSEDIMQKIPIIIIQRPGHHSDSNYTEFSAGFDIILPAEWSMPVWLSLILRCARPGGLRESKSIAQECSNLNVPCINHPDTEAYQIEAEYTKTQMIEKYFRLPPNKRINYVKFGITSPFFCEWKLLMKEWNGSDDFYIFREKKILRQLSNEIKSSFASQKNQRNGQVEQTVTSIQKLFDNIENKNCFLPVRVVVERKGIPKDFSIICLPSKEDIEMYLKDKDWTGPIESFKSDSNENKRKNLRIGHQALLRKLRRQRIKLLQKMKDNSCHIAPKSCEEMKKVKKVNQVVKKKLQDRSKPFILQQAQIMANLYLPKCESVRKSCDREVVGYVTNGSFSYSEAKGIGLGYVVATSVFNNFKEVSNFILIRNSTTRQYRICKLEILNC